MLIDKKENVVLLLLDLSAAFDTINHKLLLNKLRKMYGIVDTALNWLTCYLSNRSFRVTVNIVPCSIRDTKNKFCHKTNCCNFLKRLIDLMSCFKENIDIYLDNRQRTVSKDLSEAP